MLKGILGLLPKFPAIRLSGWGPTSCISHKLPGGLQRRKGAPGADSQLISNIQVETPRQSQLQASCKKAAQSIHRGRRAG